MTNRFEGKGIVVTGGGHGIGQAIATRMAAEGARFVVNDLDGDAATAVAASPSRSLTTTRAPSAAIRVAMAWPIPCPPPVTTIPLPSNLFVMGRASPGS